MTGLIDVTRLVRCPLLMTSVIMLLAVAGPTPVAVPHQSLGLVYVLVVAAAAAADGQRAALVSSLFAVAYAAYQPYVVGSRPDGRDIFILVFASVVVAIVVGSQHDRIARIRQDLQAEEERLQQSIAVKAEFMNAAAHELRTPITVVNGYLAMLRDGNFGPAPQRWQAVLEIVTKKAHELAYLVEQMLVSARLESDTIATATVHLDLRESVREAVERADPRATLLEASVSYQVPSGPVIVRADPEQLATILDHLVNNALTYSDGRPWVRVSVVEEADAQVLVEDHGRGIPDDMRERIFERFVRVVEPDHSLSSGTGLGLPISRDLAERQGGSLTLVRSEPGAGSVFALRLPRIEERGAHSERAPQGLRR